MIVGGICTESQYTISRNHLLNCVVYYYESTFAGNAVYSLVINSNAKKE